MSGRTGPYSGSVGPIKYNYQNIINGVDYNGINNTVEVCQQTCYSLILTSSAKNVGPFPEYEWYVLVTNDTFNFQY